MPIFYKYPYCQPAPPPPEKCYQFVCFKTDTSFAGWTIDGVPFTDGSLATAFGNGYTYTGVSIPPVPPPLPQGEGAIAWLEQPLGDPLPLPVVKDNTGTVIRYTWENCCPVTCWEIFIPKTIQRLNVVTFHKCQIEYVNYAIQVDPAGTETAIETMLDAIYPPSANCKVLTTGLGKIIKLNNIHACGWKPEVIADNNQVFQATQVPCE